MKRTISLAALAAVLASAGLARAAFQPIPITSDSYNVDIVVEKTAVPALRVVTTATVDQGTNNGANTWMEMGFDPANPMNGLPAPGTVITPPFGDVVLGGGANTVTGVNSGNPGVVNYSFKMPPSYKEPNGILIYGDGVKGLATGTFTLATPAPYAKLSFAGAGGNGGCVVGVATRHADGTSETNQFGCPDWFNGTSNVLYIANERVASSVNMTTGNANSGNPRIYFRDIPLSNTTSPVTSIDLFYVSGPSGSRNDILAVSGASTPGGAVTPIIVTGYTQDFIVEADAPKRGMVMAANGIDPATSQTMDNTLNTGFAWYEMGYNVNNPGDGAGVPIPDARVLTNSGLPAAGSTLTNAGGDRSYVLPPSYTASNAVWVAADTITEATITLATPTPASVLSFLAAAGNGPVNNIHVVSHHADGSMETNLVNVANWFDANPYIYGANGRVDVGSGQLNSVRNANLNPRLYPVDFILANTNSPVTSIDVINTNFTGGRIAIFALSGTLDIIRPSFTAQPQSATVSVGANVQFNSAAIANGDITYQWQKGTNGLFGDLANGGNISGVATPALTINPVAEKDEGDYRVIAASAGGAVTSSVVVLTVLSPLQDVTAPTDPITVYQPLGGSSPDAEAVAHAIDNLTSKYLNRGLNSGRMSVPVGFIVKPAMGRTIVTAMRMYTANDAAGRDPANYVLEGSLNGGATWTLIASNVIAMPDGRNAGGAEINPLTQALRQVRFPNTTGYTTYRWYTTLVKGTGDALMQIGEVELLGVVDTSPAPYFTQEPANIRAFEGDAINFTASATGTPAPSVRWMRDTGNGFVQLTDGGNIAGAATTQLTINPVSLADEGLYMATATNSAGGATSLAAKLRVLSSLHDVTMPGDVITSFGDTSTTYPAEATPANAIDDSPVRYRNGGQGLNAFTGFPPYEGPAGIIVTPAMGYTVVRGLRIYVANDAPERDPVAIELAGSEDGTNFSSIYAGSLSLPLDRGSDLFGTDPLTAPLQEVLFPNNRAFTSYKLTVNHVRSDIDANSFQFAEMELLGVAGAPSPKLSIQAGAAAGTLSISTTMAGTLWSSTNLQTWTSEGAINPGTPVVVPILPAGSKFYQVRPQ